MQGGARPVGEQDENDDGGQRDEVRIATPAIILLTIVGASPDSCDQLDWVAPCSRLRSDDWLASRIATRVARACRRLDAGDYCMAFS
jgi:hypothetical protein